jgi:hypothetical protein
MNISMLEKRRIEAEMIKNIYDVIVKKHGKKIAQEIISEAVIGSAIEQGKAFREEHEKLHGESEPDLLDFAELTKLWDIDDALTREVLHKSADRLDYNILRCEYANMYKKMGLGEIGHLLSCNRDGSFGEGYNEKFELTRTQTIMEGAQYCDFRHRLKKKDD